MRTGLYRYTSSPDLLYLPNREFVDRNLFIEDNVRPVYRFVFITLGFILFVTLPGTEGCPLNLTK